MLSKPRMLCTGSYGGGGLRMQTMKTLNLSSPLSLLLQPFSPNRFKFFRNPFCCFTKHNYGNSTRVSDPSNTQTPIIPDRLSQCEVDQEASFDAVCPLADMRDSVELFSRVLSATCFTSNDEKFRGVVALGKFDALHIGHRELAIRSAKMGTPYLLSFVGIAEVLGWEPRAPIVAKCDRRRVLSTWSEFCGGTTPREFEVEFSKVRSLTPRQFVEKLSKELGVIGVVAGENYRFGYRASGNASDLVTLSREYDMNAHIVSSVMDKDEKSRTGDSNDQGQVSSTRVRHALANGDMGYVSELLGRPHRLLLPGRDLEIFSSSRNRISAPTSCLLNFAPKDGLYEKCLVYIDEKSCSPCRVTIEKTHVHIDLDGVDDFRVPSDTQTLAIEFGELQCG